MRVTPRVSAWPWPRNQRERDPSVKTWATAGTSCGTRSAHSHAADTRGYLLSPPEENTAEKRRGNDDTPRNERSNQRAPAKVSASGRRLRFFSAPRVVRVAALRSYRVELPVRAVVSRLLHPSLRCGLRRRPRVARLRSFRSGGRCVPGRPSGPPL
jgi:hypothetical protein